MAYDFEPIFRRLYLQKFGWKQKYSLDYIFKYYDNFFCIWILARSWLDLCCLGASKWSFCCNGTYDEKSKFTNELLFSLVFDVYWAYHYKNTLCCKRF